VEISSSDMDVILAAWVAMAASRTGDDKIAALLQKTAYPLTEAIQKATAIVKEGVLVSADLEESEGKAVYIVEFAQDKKVVEIKLHAATGELLTKEIEDDDKTAIVKACKVTVAKGIVIATAKVPGKVVNVDSELEDGKPVIEVKVFADGKVQKVKIDGATGEILSVKSKKS